MKAVMSRGSVPFVPWAEALPNKSERSVKSAERTLALFELFALRQEPLTIGQISAYLNIPQPSVTMLVRNLVRLGYLEHSKIERKYLPTIRIMLLGSWIHRRFSLENNLEALLDNLRVNCGETVVLGLQNGIYSQYVYTQIADRPDQLEVQSGMLRPLTRTAVGRVLMSMKSDVEIGMLTRGCNAESPPHLHVSQTEINEAIRHVRVNGFAETSGDMTPGKSVIAIAIPTPLSNVPMAVGVGGEQGRIGGKRAFILEALEDLRARLIDAHESITPQAVGQAPH